MPDLVQFPSKKPARKPKRRILSATTLKALTPPSTGSVDYFDDLTRALSLGVTANEVRTWTVFYRDQHGRQKRLTLGRFPAVLLADTLELARQADRKVAKDRDTARAR